MSMCDTAEGALLGRIKFYLNKKELTNKEPIKSFILSSEKLFWNRKMLVSN